MPDDDDVNYVYVKGQGWVPGSKEPEPVVEIKTFKFEPYTFNLDQWIFDDGSSWLEAARRWMGMERRRIRRAQEPNPPPPRRVRYYPGSGEPVQAVDEEEHPRERQIREYREALRRVRRG